MPCVFTSAPTTSLTAKRDLPIRRAMYPIRSTFTAPQNWRESIWCNKLLLGGSWLAWQVYSERQAPAEKAETLWKRSFPKLGQTSRLDWSTIYKCRPRTPVMARRLWKYSFGKELRGFFI